LIRLFLPLRFVIITCIATAESTKKTLRPYFEFVQPSYRPGGRTRSSSSTAGTGLLLTCLSTVVPHNPDAKRIRRSILASRRLGEMGLLPALLAAAGIAPPPSWPHGHLLPLRASSAATGPAPALRRQSMDRRAQIPAALLPSGHAVLSLASRRTGDASPLPIDPARDFDLCELPQRLRLDPRHSAS
jgi:hypothetical protein